MKDPMTLTGRELDAAVAQEVIGWDCQPWEAYYYHLSLVLVHDVESAIERRWLVKEYIRALCDLLKVPVDESWVWTEAWAFRRATPEQICRAAIIAVRGEKEAAR